METIKILGVKINIISKQEVLEKIRNLLTPPIPPFIKGEYKDEPPKQYQIVTTNPEFIIAAQKDEEFKDIINNSWLSVADGYGIRLAAKYQEKIKNQKSKIKNKVLLKILFGLKVAWWGITRNEKRLDVVKEIIAGTDLVAEICRIMNYELGIMNKKIFLLGGFGDTAEITAEKLRQQFNNLTIEQSVFEAEKVMEKINEFQPCVLFVALNHPRAQKWIARHFQKMPSVKLAIGVGGAFDYISGKIKRAPQGMRYSFEWVFRLLMQPKRWKRIWNAVVRFPWMVFGNTLINTP